MTAVNDNPHQATYDAFNKLGADAASNDINKSSLVHNEAEALKSAVEADTGLTDSQRSNLLSQVEELLPMAGEAGNGAAWNTDMQNLVDSLMALQTTGGDTDVSSTVSDAASDDGLSSVYGDGSDLVDNDGLSSVDGDGSDSVDNSSLGSGLTNKANAGSLLDNVLSGLGISAPSVDDTIAAQADTYNSPSTLASKTDTNLYPSGNGPQVSDVHQGSETNDCTVIADLLEMAKTNPDAISNMITSDGKGNYSVNLYTDKGLTAIPVTSAMLDAQGAKSGTASTGKANWVSYVEAAVEQAIKTGQTDSLNIVPQSTDSTPFSSGADPAPVMYLLTGTAGNYNDVNDLGSDSSLINMLSNQVSQGKLVNAVAPDSAGGYGVNYIGSQGYNSNHAYAITGVDKTNQTVTLTNPWQDDSKQGGGTFTMSLADFKKAFSDLYYQS
jgi:hypothetical protein